VPAPRRSCRGRGTNCGAMGRFAARVHVAFASRAKFRGLRRAQTHPRHRRRLARDWFRDRSTVYIYARVVPVTAVCRRSPHAEDLAGCGRSRADRAGTPRARPRARARGVGRGRRAPAVRCAPGRSRRRGFAPCRPGCRRERSAAVQSTPRLAFRSPLRAELGI